MSLLNRSQTKKFVLESAAQQRAHKFSRVSKQFLDDAETDFRLYLNRKVQALPSKGKTI